MSRRYLNVDETQANLTTETARYKQRVRRGLEKPLVSQPYNVDRGTRTNEMLDKPVTIAQPTIIYYIRNFIKRFYPEIRPDQFTVTSIDPLIISWNFELTEDIK